ANSFRDACSLAGVSDTSARRWLDQAEKPNADPLLVAFRDAVERAKAERNAKLIGVVRDAAEGNGVPKDWRAATWLLSRLDPMQFSEKRTTQVTGNVKHSWGALMRSARGEQIEEPIDVTPDDEEWPKPLGPGDE